MVPSGVIFRTRLFQGSANNTLPSPSTKSPDGMICAEIAGPPSPLNPRLPFPATVVMRPEGVIRRMRYAPETKRFTDAHTANPSGELRRADSAGPPSPLDP